MTSLEKYYVVITGKLCRSEILGKTLLRFEVSTAVAMKNGVIWDVMHCGSSKNRSFGGT
jgi:hypothetical protein